MNKNQFRISNEDHKNLLNHHLSFVKEHLQKKYPDLQLIVLNKDKPIFTNYFPRRCQIICDEWMKVIDIIQN